MSIPRTITDYINLVPVDYDLLKTGTATQAEQQLMNWKTGSNPSIFVQFVPDEMDENTATSLFGNYGPIDRVEFVPKKNANGTQIGRMMFVHYSHFYKMDLADNIVRTHPEPYEMQWKPSYKEKQYVLKCRVNVRPIRRVEYSASQLTDMFESLNKRVMMEMAVMMKHIASLEAEVTELRHLRDVSVETNEQ